MIETMALSIVLISVKKLRKSASMADHGARTNNVVPRRVQDGRRLGIFRLNDRNTNPGHLGIAQFAVSQDWPKWGAIDSLNIRQRGFVPTKRSRRLCVLPRWSAILDDARGVRELARFERGHDRSTHQRWTYQLNQSASVRPLIAGDNESGNRRQAASFAKQGQADGEVNRIELGDRRLAKVD